MTPALERLRERMRAFAADGSSSRPWNELIDAVLELQDEERRQLRDICKRWFSAHSAADLSDFADWFPQLYVSHALPQLAFLCVAELSDFDRAWVSVVYASLWFAVLERRRPNWLPEYVALICRIGSPASAVWALTRRLARAGLCPLPASDDYIMTMIEGLPDRDRRLADDLRADPDLLENEVWRLFEVPMGRSTRSVSGRDRWWGKRYVEQTWAHALRALSDEGLLSRVRLLDASLEALSRDIPDRHAQWFTKFHRSLKPTSAERASRQVHYLKLLSSPSRSTVSCALEMLQPISRQVDTAQLVRGLTPLFASGHAPHAREALKLVGKSLEKGSKQQAIEVSTAVADALLHESVDVQAAALKLISRLGTAMSPAVRSQLVVHAEGLAPSLRPTLASMLPNSEQATPRVAKAGRPRAEPADFSPDIRSWASLDTVQRALEEGTDVPAVDLEMVPLPLLLDSDRLKPVEDVEQLAQLLTRLLEEHSSAVEIELALDGLSRLCDQRQPGFEKLTGPLVKRALKLVFPFAGTFQSEQPLRNAGVSHIWPDGRQAMNVPLNIGYYLCGLVLVWAAGEPPWALDARLNLVGFLGGRMQEVAMRVAAGNAGPLLATPTHRGGWIESATLEARLASLDASGRRPDRLDARQAELRVLPPALPIYRLSWQVGAPRSSPMEWGWLRDEMDEWRRQHSEMAALNMAAYGDRTGIPTEARTMLHCGVEPKRPAIARLDEVLEMLYYPLLFQPDWNRDPRDYTTSETLGYPAYDAGLLRWIATVMPHDREPFFAKGAILIGDSWDLHLRRNIQLFLEPMLDPDCPLGPTGMLLLALSLAAGSAEVRDLATDILIGGTSDGRLDAASLAAAVQPLIGTDQLKLTRLVPNLSRAAAVSELHAHVVRRMIEEVLPSFNDGGLAGLPACLSLLNELCVAAEAAIKEWPARTRLEVLAKSGSKTGRLARDLLALKGDGIAHARVAGGIALEGRISRAQRWAAAVLSRES